MDDLNFSILNGKRLIRTQLEIGKDEVIFECADGESFMLYHYQSCCECVGLAELHGDIADLQGALIISAEEVQGDEPTGYTYYESYTWTFYKIQTNKGAVTLRFLGQSNGYYSESMSFCRVSG